VFVTLFAHTLPPGSPHSIESSVHIVPCLNWRKKGPGQMGRCSDGEMVARQNADE